MDSVELVLRNENLKLRNHLKEARQLIWDIKSARMMLDWSGPLVDRINKFLREIDNGITNHSEI